jgi:hypothetical protein
MRKLLLSVKALSYVGVCVAMLSLLALQGIAQTTTSGTNINNTASASYTDGTATTYNTISNAVVVKVAPVAGLTITPDDGGTPSHSSVVQGQTGVVFTFTVNNTGNFDETVNFVKNGGSLLSSGATITSATINGVAYPLTGATVDQTVLITKGSSITVTATATITGAAGSTVNVRLGDTTSNSPTFDNQGADSSAAEVRTTDTTNSSLTVVNGLREARGDQSATVDNDGQAQANLTVPAGPVALGANITYGLQVCNTGLRTLNPIGSDTSIYEILPIPVGTTLVTQTFPTGAQYSTDALTTSPTTATWVTITGTTTAAALATAKRVRVPVATSLAASTCSSTFNIAVQVTTLDATTPIYAIAETFAKNSVNATVTDQSGDTVSNKGDSNADFNEPLSGGTVSTTQGFQQPTTLVKTGSVQIGPSGAPAATGPTSTNDDYTNKSVNTGIGTVAPGGVTTVAGTVVFTNTIKNNGNANDTYTLTAPTVPTGFTVEISTNGGTSYTTVSGGGNTTVAIAFGATANILVRITSPIGETVLTGYDTVIRATSGIDTSKTNDTIDRLYTGFIRLDKTAVVTNGTGVGAATDPVPGAVITYTIKYTNVSSTGGTGSIGLTANNLVITEDGTVAPNNWGTFTTQVVGSGKDYTGATGTTAGTGVIAGDAALSNVLTDTVASVAPAAIGRFVFQRTIK